MNSGAMATRLNKFEPDPNAMYDRSTQDKYEHDVHEMFQKERQRRRIDKSKTLGKRVSFMDNSKNIVVKPRAKRKRSSKRLRKLTPLQEAQRFKYSDHVINKILSKYKHSLTTVEQIFSPLSQRHTTKPFQFVSPLFSDGFGLNDIVFDTMDELASFFAEKGVHIYTPQRSWRDRVGKKEEDMGLKQKQYFIRLKDENALITPQLLQNLAKAMNDLRIEAFQIKSKIKRIEKGDELTAEEIKQIQEQCSNIYIQKFDNTRDFQGCVYSTDYKTTIKKLCELLGFTKRKSHTSSQSCFQFNKEDGSRHKLYSKDIHLLTFASTTKMISIGLKPIFASRLFRQKLSKCTTMSRSEHSAVFYSVEEEQACLLNSTTCDIWNNNHKDIITKINNNQNILTSMNCDITRKELWQMFFNGIQTTLVLKSRKEAAIVYAKSDIYQKKFVGLFARTSNQTTTMDLASKYGWQTCQLFSLISENNYSVVPYKKLSQEYQLPIVPFSFKLQNFDILKEIGIDPEEFGFKAIIDPARISMEQLADIQQIGTGEPEQSRILVVDSAEEIEGMYSRHKGEIRPYSDIDKSVLIHGIRCTNGKLNLYDYNNDCKYQLKYTFADFAYLEDELVKLQHSLIEGMYVFMNGIESGKVGEYLGIAHYSKLKAGKQQQEEKERQIQEEKERKDKARKALRSTQFRIPKAQEEQKLEEQKLEEQKLQNENERSVVEEVQFEQQWQELPLPIPQIPIPFMSGQRAAALRNRSRSPSPVKELGEELSGVIEKSATTISYDGVTFNKKKPTVSVFYPYKNARPYNIKRVENTYFMIVK